MGRNYLICWEESGEKHCYSQRNGNMDLSAVFDAAGVYIGNAVKTAII